MSAEIIKLLRKTPIFSALDSDSLKRICDYFKEKTYSADELLFKEGSLEDTLYIIKEGGIRITSAAKEGKAESSRVLRREGDIFGESGFIDESPRPVTAVAIKPTKVFQLSRSDFLTVLNNDPLIACQIIKVLSLRLKQADLRVIEELKEENEQLQQAIRRSEGASDKEESGSWLEESAVSLGEREIFFERIFSSIPYAVVCTREDDNIRFFNEAAEREFGYTAEEVMHKPIETLWSEGSWSKIYQHVAGKLTEQNQWEGEIIAAKNNGEHFLCQTTICKMQDENGKDEGKLCICRDVTQRRSQEKTERIGEDAALTQQTAEEIANSVNREVKKLSDVFDTLPSELNERNFSKSQNKINVIRNVLDGIKGMVSELSASRSPELDRQPIDLEHFFRGELLLLKSDEKFRDITLAIHFEENTPKVNANRRQFQQMLYAILDNSASALEPVTDRSRTITIEVGRASQGSEVQIQISDNGTGISEANLSKIFKEPFSTKRAGLGLGLLSVARTVQDHGGDVEVYSDEGTYTLFVIKLPAYQEKQTFRPQEEPALRS